MSNWNSLVAENVLFYPEEIWFEILSRLGVKSLLRCKSVCKIWYAVIKSRHFVNMHARNTRRFCNIKRKCKLLNSDGSTEEIRYISNSCEGFLLVKNLFFASATAMPLVTYQISNPKTKRVLDLPRPRDFVQTMFVFLNSSTSSYNVVSVFHAEDKKNLKLELIDLGVQSNDSRPNTDFSWITLNIPEFDNSIKHENYLFRYCMSGEGVFYALCLDTSQVSKPIIFCADLINQTSTTLNAPESLWFKWRDVHFQLWRGQPSIIFKLEEKLNVWMLEDYKKQKWADMIVIPMPFLAQYPNSHLWSTPQIYQVDKEECLMFPRDGKTNYIYKLGTKEFCIVPTLCMRVPATLVSVKGMQSKTMKPGSKYIDFPRLVLQQYWQ